MSGFSPRILGSIWALTLTHFALLALVELGAQLVGTHSGFRYAQVVTFGTMALGHGMQDAQQTMRSMPLALSPQVGAASRLSAVRWSAVGAVAAGPLSITDLFVG